MKRRQFVYVPGGSHTHVFSWGEVREHSRVALPPSREPTLVHTNVVSLPYENPHSYTQMSSPYLTRTHTHTRTSPPYNIRSRQETELLKTYSNRNRQLASQPVGRTKETRLWPAPKVHRKNDYYWWKFGDNMICHYYIPLLRECFFLFFFFWGPFLWFFLPKIYVEFFLYLQFSLA